MVVGRSNINPTEQIILVNLDLWSRENIVIFRYSGTEEAGSYLTDDSLFMTHKVLSESRRELKQKQEQSRLQFLVLREFGGPTNVQNMFKTCL